MCTTRKQEGWEVRIISPFDALCLCVLVSHKLYSQLTNRPKRDWNSFSRYNYGSGRKHLKMHLENATRLKIGEWSRVWGWEWKNAIFSWLKCVIFSIKGRRVGLRRPSLALLRMCRTRRGEFRENIWYLMLVWWSFKSDGEIMTSLSLPKLYYKFFRFSRGIQIMKIIDDSKSDEIRRNFSNGISRKQFLDLRLFITSRWKLQWIKKEISAIFQIALYKWRNHSPGSRSKTIFFPLWPFCFLLPKEVLSLPFIVASLV